MFFPFRIANFWTGKRIRRAKHWRSTICEAYFLYLFYCVIFWIMRSLKPTIVHKQCSEKMYKTDYLPPKPSCSPLPQIWNILQPAFFTPAQCCILIHKLPLIFMIHPNLSNMKLHVKKPSRLNNPFRIFNEQTKSLDRSSYTPPRHPQPHQ